MGKKITMVLLAVLLGVLLCSTSMLMSCYKVGTGSPQSEQSSDDSSTLLVSDSQSVSGSSSQSASISTAVSSSSSAPASISSSTSKSVSKSASVSASISTSASKSKSASASTVPAKKYYVGGSWNGYLANDENCEMKLVSGSTTFYTLTVVLTAANRDPTYDGHWYKVTEGSWTSPTYGIDNYVQQPAPVKKVGGSAIGLGSIWIDQNMTLTILFDSAKKIVYDNANGKTLPTP